MEKVDVVVIGGGATGTGILRDLAMRGVKALLLEQRDLAYGTSSRFHGLLHSGGRYAVKDAESGRECIEENTILRKIGKYCVEDTEGFFVRTVLDDEAYEGKWLEACSQLGIPATPLAINEALKLEPGLSSDIRAVYRVPDAAIDGFRLVWQNAASAARYGSAVRTYTEVIGIYHENNEIVGVEVRHSLTGAREKIACKMLVNAAGSWVGQVARLAGVDVAVKPDRGTLIAFNHRLCNRVINRLRAPGDADIFVPHGSITILGTTSKPTERPDAFESTKDEVIYQLAEGKALFEDIDNYRILRVFAGTRPLYSPDASGRNATRNFVAIDHAQVDSLRGMITVVGGKLTTYRLMAEKTVDKVCQYLNIKEPCRTAEEPLVPDLEAGVMAKAKKVLPAYSADRVVARLGSQTAEVVDRIESDQTRRQLVCECELVTLAEVEAVAADKATNTLDDIRRKTRMGMGTCQGAFCGLRGVGAMVTYGLEKGQPACQLLEDFLQSRWSGVKPVLWGHQLRETELTRAIYGATLNINGAMPDETK